jgi:phosphate transport system permease protein
VVNISGQKYTYAEGNPESLIKSEKIAGERLKGKKIRELCVEFAFLLISILSALMILIVFIFIAVKSSKVLGINGLKFITQMGFDTQIFDSAKATAESPVTKFGAYGLLIGTLYTSIGALIFSVPIGILTAVVITELSPIWMRRFLQTFVRYLASIPSIIYGLIGLLVVLPFLKDNFITMKMQEKYVSYFPVTGKSLIAGIIVLSIMILPIITALTIDALKAVPKRYKEASLALGLSHWRTIVKVLLPSAKSGIFAGIILATGVAVGEAIALSMITGGKGMVPNPALCVSPFDSLLTPVLTLASAIVTKSETLSGEYTSSALFACGVVLLLACTILSLLSKAVDYIVKRRVGID